MKIFDLFDLYRNRWQMTAAQMEWEDIGAISFTQNGDKYNMLHTHYTYVSRQLFGARTPTRERERSQQRGHVANHNSL